MHVLVLPDIFVWSVASSLCPSAFCLQVLLLWRRFDVMPCVQQYAIGVPLVFVPCVMSGSAFVFFFPVVAVVVDVVVDVVVVVVVAFVGLDSFGDD